MINNTEFKRRRQQLMQRLAKNSIAIIPTATEKTRNRDAEYAFRPDSDFVYLTGFNEPESVALFLPEGKKGKFILFCRERNIKMEIWNGRRAGLEGAKKDYGANEVYSIDWSQTW